MFWLNNELTRSAESAVRNTVSVCNHIVKSEVEDFNHGLHRQNKAMQAMQQDCLQQAAAFWSFWFPQR